MVDKIKKKTPKGALERLAELESVIPAMVTNFNNTINDLNNTLYDLDETVQAIAEVVGAEKVQEKVNERAQARAQAQADKAKAWVDDNVKAGRLVLSQAVTENSLIVGIETDKTGKTLGVGREQLHYSRLFPNFKEALLGKAPGFRMDTPTGGVFEILEVYDPAVPAVIKDVPVENALPEQSPPEAPIAEQAIGG